MKYAVGKPISLPIPASLNQTNSLLIRNLKFCPSCIKDDVVQRGEPFWHVIHQADSVTICPIHELPLIERCPICGKNYPLSSSCYHLININCSCGTDLRELRIYSSLDILGDRKHEVLLCRDTQFLLDHYQGILKINNWSEVYKTRLKEMGLLTSTGYVKQRELLESFRMYYGESLLQRLNSFPLRAGQINWISNIFNKRDKPVHPLRHLLLIRFLFGSVENCLSFKENNFQPFGKGPFPCLNPTSAHFRENIITSYHETNDRKTKKVVGIFTCGNCGFSYSRNEPDCNKEGAYQIRRILRLGEDTESLIDKLRAKEPGISIKDLSKSLCSDRSLSYQFTNRVRKVVLNETSRNVPSLIVINRKRGSFVRALDCINNVTISKLKKVAGAEYAWPTKYDVEWLNQVKPCAIKPKPLRRSMNWESRDNALVKLVRNKIDENLKSNIKPVRITRSWLTRATGESILSDPKRLIHLPKTSEIIQKNIEDIHDYRRRKLVWAFNEVKSKYPIVKRYHLISKLGARNLSESLHQLISEAVNKQSVLPLI
nr:TnsD family Tn7-like transposition protein [Paenibacillus tyrfis]